MNIEKAGRCSWSQIIYQLVQNLPPVLFSREETASAQAWQTWEEQSEATRHLYQKLSVLLARGNAALLLNRFPTFASPDIDGVE